MRRALALTSLLLASFAGAPAPATAADIPRAVKIARATAIPDCTLFVDASAKTTGDGTQATPFKKISGAVAAADPGAVICVTEGTYAETITPGEKYFTLAGGFQRGSQFKARDSAKYVSKAKGNGGSFFLSQDPAPSGQLTAIDGFEITGYSRAIVRDFYVSQRFDVTNNYIHDNVCADETLVGGGVALVNVSGAIRGNVFERNSCGRGGAVFLNDTLNENTVVLEANRVDGNAGTEADSAHGGAFYLFGNTLKITGNEFSNNLVTQWGAGLYVGAYTQGNQPTTATIAWNVYRQNRAGNSGGGFFCDDGATCNASHEVYDSNCGGNIMVDGGPGGSGPTTARFDHVTNVGARSPDCKEPGIGFFVNTYEAVAPDSYSVTNSLFWGNGAGLDLATACDSGCKQLKVSVANTMVETKYGDGNVKIAFGTGILAPSDPKFVAADKGDFHLAAGSPAIGKGAKGSDLGAYGASADTAAPAEASREQGSPAEPGAGNVAVPVKEAFAAAKDVGTAEAWQAFLKTHADGFYADLARAYLKKLRQAAD